MEKLPKDLKRRLALELSPSDLIRFCVSEKKMYEDICNSKEFWREKIARDFPEVFTYFQRHKMILSNPKKTYIRKFTEVSKLIDEFLKAYPENIRAVLYNDIYDIYEEKKKGDSEDFYDFKPLSQKYAFYLRDRLDFESSVGSLLSKLMQIYYYYKM